jgi:hypothetical protein
MIVGFDIESIMDKGSYLGQRALSTGTKKQIFELAQDDHVVELRATSEKGLLRSIEFVTTKKRRFKAVGSSGPGSEVREHNLRNKGEVLIGF